MMHYPECAEAVPIPGERVQAFMNYGGKYSHLDWLLPMLPDMPTYCEPFAGSACVLLNRRPAPVETMNDIYGDIVRFFRVLRDHTDELIRVIELTPYAREEYNLALQPADEHLSDVERARRFFVLARMSWGSVFQRATPGLWSLGVLNFTKATKWQNATRDFQAIANRLRRVQIDNRPALEVIQQYNNSQTMLYVDPPYPMQSRRSGLAGARKDDAYAHGMTEEDHRELAAVLRQYKGKVAISGYSCPLMHELYGDWPHTNAPTRYLACYRGMRQEVLWTNYQPPNKGLFDGEREEGEG